MSAETPAITPDVAWAEMRVHLEWSERLCLCFLFSDSNQNLATIWQWLNDAIPAVNGLIRIVAPSEPETAAQAVLQRLFDWHQRERDVPVWLEMLAIDQPGNTVWDAARATLLARLNESRSWLTREFVRPLIICLPENWAKRAPEIAPDLWHVRTYTARLGLPPPVIKTEPVRENMALASLPGAGLEQRLQEMLQGYQQAQVRLQRADAHQRVARQRELMLAAGELGKLWFERRQIKNALACFQEMVASARQLRSEFGNATPVLRDLVAALNHLGDAQAADGDNDAALTTFHESLDTIRNIPGWLGNQLRRTREVAITLQKIGDVESNAGRLEVALDAYSESLAMFQQVRDERGVELQDLLQALEKVRNAEKMVGKRAPALLGAGSEYQTLQMGSGRKSGLPGRRVLGSRRVSAKMTRIHLAKAIKQENWKIAATAARNLSELALMVGDLDAALQHVKQAMDYADRSGSPFLPIIIRASYADALHQAGQSQLATKLFGEAEAMQAESQPAYPLLYSLPGFQFGELLLAEPELAAWQATVANILPLPGKSQANLGKLIQTCQHVNQRAAQTLAWVEQNDQVLSDLALNHLTLAQAALYVAILTSSTATDCQSELQLALASLRRAGNMNYLPRALLGQAWQFAYSGQSNDRTQAEALLNEAWQIAESGPMPLFMAEVHLFRAGLFHHSTPYPWQTPALDLQAARQLIEKHGYLRRMAMLEVVERAIGDKV